MNNTIQEILQDTLALLDSVPEVEQTYSEDDIAAIGIILFKLSLEPGLTAKPARELLRMAATSWFMEIKNAKPQQSEDED